LKPPKAKKYIYAIKSDLELTKGMTISFRADNRKEADEYAASEMHIFGATAKAVFMKEI